MSIFIWLYFGNKNELNDYDMLIYVEKSTILHIEKTLDFRPKKTNTNSYGCNYNRSTFDPIA